MTIYQGLKEFLGKLLRRDSPSRDFQSRDAVVELLLQNYHQKRLSRTQAPPSAVSHSIRIATPPLQADLEDYCPVCGRPDGYCVICGTEHEVTRPHTRVAGEEVRFSREDLLAVEREASAWEGSREYDNNVHGVRAHTLQLRSLAQRIATLLTYTG